MKDFGFNRMGLLDILEFLLGNTWFKYLQIGELNDEVNLNGHENVETQHRYINYLT